MSPAISGLDGIPERARHFLELSRQEPSGRFSSVHRTELASDAYAPRWDTFVVPLDALCFEDIDRPIRIKLKTFFRVISFLGEAYTTLRHLLVDGKVPIEQPYSASDLQEELLTVEAKNASAGERLAVLDAPKKNKQGRIGQLHIKTHIFSRVDELKLLSSHVDLSKPVKCGRKVDTDMISHSKRTHSFSHPIEGEKTHAAAAGASSPTARDGEKATADFVHSPRHAESPAAASAITSSS